jgi:ankyrin repeat protein
MSRSLPERPNLDWLRKTAKQALKQLREHTPSARLADAQLAVAREYGFNSWRKLVRHVQVHSVPDDGTTPLPARIDEALVASFLRLVGTGQVEAVRQALSQTPHLVNAVGPHPFWGGRPQPLHVAIETKRREIFDMLLEHGANVNGENDQYDLWSPLMIAVNRARQDMQDELIRGGAHVGLVEALMLGDDRRLDELLTDRTLLLQAVPNAGSLLMFARTVHAIDCLIEAGVAPNLADKWGSTPIRALSQLGEKSRPLVHRLIEYGVEASPEEYARLGDEAALARLAESNPDQVRADGVLLAAIASGHLEIVRWLLRAGANVNGRSADATHHTALHEASWTGSLPIVQLLVTAGVDVTARDDKHNSTARGWAETAATVTNNPNCTIIADFLAGFEGNTTP